MSTTQDLIRLREKLEKEKTKRDETAGALKGLYERLKTSFDVTTLDQARKAVAKMKAKAEDLKTKLTTGIEELEEKHSWQS